jgi:hypothetical protein
MKEENLKLWAPIRSQAVGQRLMTSRQAIGTGTQSGMDAESIEDLERTLDELDPAVRGFACEGMSLALALADSVDPDCGWIRRWLAGRGDAYEGTVHLGVGWALARLPESSWPAIIPEHPILRWMALDGYGLQRTYGRTREYVVEHYVQPSFPTWPGSVEDANQVVDQGIGRALWFISGVDVERAAANVEGFPEARRGDLWAGIGLAASFAGGAEPEALRRLAASAGALWPYLAQGAAFASAARRRSGDVVADTDQAVEALCDGVTAEEAAAVVEEAKRDLPVDGPTPGYHVWQRRIRERLVTLRASSGATAQRRT